MNVEMQSIKDNQVWELVDLPPNGKTVGSKWLFKKKTDMDCVVHTYKAHLVAKGFTQTYEVDDKKTFSPVADIGTIRILIAITVFYDNKIWQMDVKTAFLNGHLLEVVYMVQLEEAEYIAASNASNEAVWVRKFIFRLGVVPTIEEPIKMYCDNTRAITIANESGITKGAGHYRAKVHYLRELVEFGDIKLEKVNTHNNLTDPFTKALPFFKHSEHTKNIGMLSASSLMQIYVLLSQELKTVSYHKLYDILKQHHNEVNEIRAKRLACTANPLALVAQNQPAYHPQHNPNHYTQNSSTRSQQTTKNEGKEIVNSSAPIYDHAPDTITEDDEMSKNKEIDKLMALISLSFKKIYKPTESFFLTP
nr:putative retrotransposon Ty1-copia subclass protein [Tanacetum cinerariifolium]